MEISFNRLAERELNDAAQYYELESRGLGAAFIAEVGRSCAAKPDEIRILAVMNLKRRPTYWVSRMRDLDPGR